jgi:hypothetical protein
MCAELGFDRRHQPKNEAVAGLPMSLKALSRAFGGNCHGDAAPILAIAEHNVANIVASVPKAVPRLPGVELMSHRINGMTPTGTNVGLALALPAAVAARAVQRAQACARSP